MHSSLPSSLSHVTRRVQVTLFLLIISLLCCSVNSYAGFFGVSNVVPAKNALNVSSTTTLTVTFNGTLQTNSFNDTASFIVTGVTSGRHSGLFEFSGGNTIASFTPTVPFQKGEMVVVDITNKIKDLGNAGLYPFVYSFTVGVNSTSGTLLAKTDYATGSAPQSVFVCDIDGDGDGDILLACSGINGVSVLKNNGDGTFATKVDYTTGNYSTFVYAVDIDGDGDADILTANYTANSVSVLKNNGDGTFQPKVDYTTAIAPVTVYASDLDGDGDVDIVVASVFSIVSVLKNNGDGTFAPKSDYATGSETFSAITTDVDGDGDQDIITVNRSGNNVSILKNFGNGSFAAKVDYATQTSPTKIYACDVDGDGDEDIITSSYSVSTVAVLKNNGNGSFKSAVEYPAGGYTYSCFANDIDGDGDADILTANLGGNSVSILKNNGDGTFQTKVDYTAGSSPSSAYASDLDGDGDIDVVVANFDANTVSVLLNNTLSVTLSITSVHGTVTKSPDQVNYTPGTQVEITAIPQKGYLFSSWSGDAIGNTNPLTITMSANKSITANYILDPLYQAMYRTAKVENWALATDAKGKRVSVKRKFDKDFFEFYIIADTARPLSIDFGMKVNATITWGDTYEDTVGVVTNLSKFKDSLNTVAAGETLQISGIGEKGKKLAAKYSWGKKKAVTLKADSLYAENTKGLPMPNLINVGEELFPKGFGNASPYFPKPGLVMGIPQGTKKAKSMLLKKFGDVLTTLAKKGKKGYILDTANVRCLDSLGKKAIAKQLGATGPDKYQNKFLAEALALKLNIAASNTQKFPGGLEILQYTDASDPTNSFNNMFVGWISAYADSMLSCVPVTSLPTATMSELFSVMHNINIAFADSPYTVDTLSFGAKTQLKGLKKLIDVAYLIPGNVTSAQNFGANSTLSNGTPAVFALNQNYPNPFNPTTQLSFVLGNSSMVTLKVYDILGKEVATLLNNENVESGAHEVTFNASNFASGVYFYRITTQSVDANGVQSTFTDVKRMMFVK